MKKIIEKLKFIILAFNVTLISHMAKIRYLKPDRTKPKVNAQLLWISLF